MCLNQFSLHSDMGDWSHWFFVLAEHWGYWIAVAATFLETLPVIGGIFPGQTILVASGFLARIDVLNPFIITALAATAAIIGDCLAYWLGRRYGLSVMKRLGQLVSISPSALQATREKLEKNAGKTLIIGRFLPVTRALAPFMAGASRVKPHQFLVFNSIGGLAWSIASVSVGYIAGASYQIAAAYFGRALMVLLLVIVCGWALVHWYRRYRVELSATTLGAIILHVAGIAAFALLAYATTRVPSLHFVDWQISEWVAHIRTPGGIAFWSVVTKIFNPVPALVLSTLLLIWTWRLEYKIGRWLPVVAMVGGVTIGFLIKASTDLPRPEFAVMFVPGSTFPSLHATAAALFMLIVVWIVAPKLRPGPLRRWLPLGASAFCLLIGWSRVYLGVHWLSDVLAGYALALAWFSFVILFYAALRHTKSSPPV